MIQTCYVNSIVAVSPGLLAHCTSPFETIFQISIEHANDLRETSVECCCVCNIKRFYQNHVMS